MSGPAVISDPLLDEDADVAADAAATDALLRCWMRETGTAVTATGSLLALALPACGVVLNAGVRHRSPSGWHRFERPRFAATGALAGAPALAGLLASEVASRAGADPVAVGGLALRVLESAEVVSSHVATRRRAPTDPSGACSFLAAEQALLLGHPFHPAPKSRPAATGEELRTLSPELRGRLRLHWLAAHPSVAAGGSAASGLDAAAITRALATDVVVPAGWTAVPVHPWQARQMRARAGLAELLDAGLLRDLGPSDALWSPTSSVRTVFRPGAGVMLKLSLGLRITNSRRENLRAEMLLGVRASRLLDVLEPALRAAHPGFRVLRDPAWVGVDPGAGIAHSGLDVALRESPFAPEDPVVCLAGLVAERPEGDGSRLAVLLREAAGQEGEPVATLAERWVARFVDAIIAPVLWLLDVHGLGLEAHQQNLLVVLGTDGLPAGGWYRDSQGFYVAERRAAEALAAVPDLQDGVSAIFDDGLVEDRVAYYAVVNALLGLVGALGAEGIADERALLRATAARLRPLAARGDRLATRVLSAATLPCKANLLTCADGRDELDGPVESQSVYVDVPNPLREPPA